MADETPSTAGLTMDRGLALGNSPGSAGRRRLHTFIDQNGTPIPVAIVSSTGSPFHAQFRGETDPGVEQSLITFVVPSVVRTLKTVAVVCRTPGMWELDIGGTTWASGRTGAGHPESPFPFDPGFPVTDGIAVTLKFTARAGHPPAALEAYLMADDQPA